MNAELYYCRVHEKEFPSLDALERHFAHDAFHREHRKHPTKTLDELIEALPDSSKKALGHYILRNRREFPG